MRPIFAPETSATYVDYQCGDVSHTIEIELEGNEFVEVTVDDFSANPLRGFWSAEPGNATTTDPQIDGLSFQYQNPSALETVIYLQMIRTTGQTGAGRIHFSAIPTW
jgi:hypothetical protein